MIMPRAPYQDFKLSEAFVKKYITPFVRPNGDFQSAPVFIEFAVRDYVIRNAFYLQKANLIRKRDVPKLFYEEDLVELTSEEQKSIQDSEMRQLGHRLVYDIDGHCVNIPGIPSIDFTKHPRKDLKAVP